jgi:hypothetical protein
MVGGPFAYRGLEAPSQRFANVAFYAVYMQRQLTAAALVLASLGLTGCVSNPLSESISSLQVCTESVRILTEMEDVLRLALANPLAADTYTDRLTELSDEFKALAPQEPTLAAAHGDLSAQIDVVLETVANPSISGVADLPTVIAESQIALMDYTAACTPGG